MQQTTPLWKQNIKNVLLLRVKKLSFSDALICENTGWRVDCIPDEYNQKLYVLMLHDEIIVQRKRIDSIIAQLISNDVPDTLEYVMGGAISDQNVRNTDQPFIGQDRQLYIDVSQMEHIQLPMYNVRVLFSARQKLRKSLYDWYHTIRKIFIKESDVSWTYGD